jgi:hypothetical protein
MIKVDVYKRLIDGSGYSRDELSVWHASLGSENNVLLWTGLNESSAISVNSGDVIKIYDDDEADDLELLNLIDHHNLVETINCRMNMIYYNAIRNEQFVSFRQVDEICSPAYAINAMSHRDGYIYSVGAQSLADKIYRNSTREVGLIREVNYKNYKLTLVGGFNGMPVKFLNERALHEFAGIVNEYFPD